MNEILARLRHLFGYHTPVRALRDESIWCWICGIRLMEGDE